MNHTSEIVRYSQLVMPQDANVVGTLFGGQMISWMDIAVSKASHRILKKSPADSAVTRAIDATEFKEPVYVGEWVNFEAVVTKLGKTSIKVNVKAFSEGRHDDRRLACVAEFTMVAVKQQEDGSYIKCTHSQTLDL
jgi:acyl-CoA thioesterase YciA